MNSVTFSVCVFIYMIYLMAYQYLKCYLMLKFDSFVNILLYFQHFIIIIFF